MLIINERTGRFKKARLRFILFKDSHSLFYCGVVVFIGKLLSLSIIFKLTTYIAKEAYLENR